MISHSQRIEFRKLECQRSFKFDAILLPVGSRIVFLQHSLGIGFITATREHADSMRAVYFLKILLINNYIHTDCIIW